MGVAHAGDSAAGALLPLSLQNSYRARYRAMRPGWQSSGDQLEALVRGLLTPDSWVLDHVKQPLQVLREVARVLRPGGHFVFLTPNLRNPLVLMNRIGKAIPLLQTQLVSRFYGRRESDTFPVQYRANTARAIQELAEASDLRVAELRVVPDPTYLALNGLMFRTSVFAERLMPKGWGVHLLGDLTRR